MNAQSNAGKVYVHILELHRNITDENVRDSIPELKIATIEGSSYINWQWIFSHGYMPLVKASPTITKSSVSEHLFTPEFWTCKCEFDWLHALHYKCDQCDAFSFYHKDHGPNLHFTIDFWGSGQFDSVELSSLKMMKIVAEMKDMAKPEYPSAMKGVQTIYKHLKAFNFDWVKAFSIENF
jgi:hypothetical protein